MNIGIAEPIKRNEIIAAGNKIITIRNLSDTSFYYPQDSISETDVSSSTGLSQHTPSLIFNEETQLISYLENIFEAELIVSGLFNKNISFTDLDRPERIQDANLNVKFEQSSSTENLSLDNYNSDFEQKFDSIIKLIENELYEETEEEKSLDLIRSVISENKKVLLERVYLETERSILDSSIISKFLIQLGIINRKSKSEEISLFLHDCLKNKNPQIRYSSLVGITYNLPLINLDKLEHAYSNEDVEALKTDMFHLINRITKSK